MLWEHKQAHFMDSWVSMGVDIRLRSRTCAECSLHNASYGGLQILVTGQMSCCVSVAVGHVAMRALRECMKAVLVREGCMQNW